MKNEKPIWTLGGIAGVLVIYFSPWRFQVNDDVALAWLISGTYTGVPESYALFIHPLYSSFLANLYKTAHEIPWYAIQIYLILIFSLILGIKSVFETSLKGPQRVLILSIFLTVSLHLALLPQFTLISGWGATMGLIYLQVGTKWKSWLLFFLAAMIRVESAGLVLLGFGLFSGVFNLKKTQIIRYGTLGSLILILLVSQKVWEDQSEYKDFLRFNRARASVLDHPVFYEDTRAEKFERSSTWFYPSNWLIEKSHVNIDILKAKKAELDQRQWSIYEFKRSIQRLFKILIEDTFKGTICLILILTILINPDQLNKKTWFSIGIWFTFLLIFNHFFHLKGRVLFLFFLPLLSLSLGESITTFKSQGYAILATATVVFFSIFAFNFYKSIKERMEVLSQMELLVGNSKEPIRLEGLPLEFLSKEYLIGNRINFLLDGWIARSPFQERALEKIDLNDFYQIKSYKLIGMKKHSPFIFQDYMNSFGKTYVLIEKKETKDLILYHYRELN